MDDTISFDYNILTKLSNAYTEIVDYYVSKAYNSEISYSAYNDIAEDYSAYRGKLGDYYNENQGLSDKNRDIILSHLRKGRDLLIEDRAGTIHLYVIDRAIKALRN